MRTRRDRAIVHAVVFAGYGLFFELGLALGSGGFDISPLWPAVGFAVAAVRAFGYPLAVTVALSDLAMASLHAGAILPSDALEAVLAGAVAALGAALLRTTAPRFGEPGAEAREGIRFLAFACVGTALVSALTGTAALWGLGGLPAAALGSTLHTWWLGDAVGILITAPLVLVCLDPGQRRIPLQRPIEGVLALLGTLGATLLAFGGNLAPLAPSLEPATVVMPFLVWGALRFGLTGAAACNFLVGLTVAATAALGLGPYAAGDADALLGVQFLTGVVGGTILLLGVTVSRRDRLQRVAQRQTEFVESITQNLPGAVFRQRLTGDGRIEFSYIAGRLAEAFGMRAGPDEDDRTDTNAPIPTGEPRFEESDHTNLVAALERSQRTREPVELDLRIRDDDGRHRWGRIISRPSRDRQDGTIWDGILLDVTEEKRQRARVEYLATHDPLTGLLNRHGLHEQLAPLLARAARQGQRLAFWLFDLDGFKGINDTYGHTVGDAVLHAIGERLRGMLRQEDLKARLGGDEFLLVQLDPAEHGSIEQTCRRALESLSAPVDSGAHRLHPTLSMGVAIYPGDGQTADALLAAADHALYAAKKREQGNLVFHGSALSAEDPR